MITMTCINRVTDANNKIIEYQMCENSGVQRTFTAERLKTLIKRGQVQCVNLTLTKDDRLILKLATKTAASKPEVEKSLPCVEQLKQHLMRQKLMGLPPDAEYVVDKKGRVLLKTVFVKDGTYTIPSFVSGYSRAVLGTPFMHCKRLKVINKSAITNMRRLFAYSDMLELDLSEFDTSLVTNMTEMFFCSYDLTVIRGKLNTSRVLYMNSMFASCRELSRVDLSCFDTSRVEDMSFMLFDCHSIVSFDGSHWDTSRVVDMSSMFGGCKKLRSADLRSFTVLPDAHIQHMFACCDSLKTLFLSSDLKKRRLELGLSTLAV